MWSVLAFLAFGQVFLAHAAIEFDAYRLIQYDYNGEQLGSRRSTVDHVMTTLALEPEYKRTQLEETQDEHLDYEDEEESPAATPTLSTRGPGDLTRKMVVVEMEGLTSDAIHEIVNLRRASSVLIVLDPDAELSEQQLESYKAVEQYLLGHSFPIAIYFAFKDENLKGILESLENKVMVDRYQLSIPGPEAVKQSTIPFLNLQGWHHSAPSYNGDPAATIAVVSYYDTFGAAPGLSFGVGRSGTGAVALLELVRTFSRLYSEFRTHGSYNLLFLLTGAGHMNYVGTKSWLRAADSRVLESMEFVLCLDEIGGDDLHLVVSRPPTKPDVAPYLQTFLDSAEDLGASVDIIHSKINISNPIANWHHELFSRERIVAATLTSRDGPASLFSGSSIFDTSADSELLVRNIRLVAESLCKIIYPHSEGLRVLEGSHAVNANFVNMWLDFFSKEMRVSAYLTKDSEVISQMQQVMSQYTSDWKRSSFSLSDADDAPDLTYYKHATKTRVSAHRVKPVTFDLYLSVSIVAYLVVFHQLVQSRD